MKNFKKLCIGTVSLAMMFTSTVAFAVEDAKLTPSLTEDFVKWQSLSGKEKSETLMPRVSTFDIPEEANLEDISTYSSLRNTVTTGGFVKNAKAALVGANDYNLARYHLGNAISLEVKHQGSTNECWAFSMTSVLETNLAMTQNIKKKFSPRHMDYSSIRTFTDGVNSDNLNREAGQGGLAQFGVAYLSNGRGAVLESDMPFEDNSNKISISSLNKKVDTIVTDTITFPALYKEYDASGNITYTNGGTGNNKKIYSEAEVAAFRKEIKKHIVQYGAISAVTAGNENRFYSNPSNISAAGSYFCNDNTIVRDHAVTIVGWDDNYSRTYFTGAAQPKSNGAYICLNSYGPSNFDRGYVYISYEDSLIETYLYGIKTAGSVDYDNIYQYNPTGSNTSVGVSNVSRGFVAQVFSKDSSKTETLKYVGIDLPEKMSLKIYVNPTGDNPALSACNLVATTEVLSAGYHRIPVTETKLTGGKFTIVVEETSPDSRFEFAIEIAFSNSIYSTILGNPGKCLYSLNGTSWSALSSEQVSGFDMRTADTTIKAFTIDGTGSTNPPAPETPEEPSDPETPEDPTEPETPETPEDPTEPDKPTAITLSSTEYKISGTDIYKIAHDTTIQNFKTKITTNSTTVEFYDSASKKIEQESTIIKTGTTIKLSDGKTYTLIVRGDVNCDGKISLVDLSKIVAHYGDKNRYGLTGYVLKAADLNVDGKISLVDISQIVDMIGHL